MEAENRCFFVVTGLAQPLKLKLASRSALKSLFSHIPFTHAELVPEFYWKDMKLDGNCCPADYGMLPGPQHVQTIETRIPRIAQEPVQPTPVSNAATARVYASMNAMSLLGAMTQSPAPVVRGTSATSSPPSHTSPAVQSAKQPIPTERLVEELQYAVKVHSESALRLNEQLAGARHDLSEVTDVMSRENRKLAERVGELEQQLQMKEHLRQELQQQSTMTIHQHLSSFEQERESRREEVDSLRRLISALSVEKDVVVHRNEELSRTLRQQDEEWAADMERFTEQQRVAHQHTLQLEARISELVGTQQENMRLAVEINRLKPFEQRERQLLEEMDILKQHVASLQERLIAANGTVVAQQSALEERDGEVAALKRELAGSRQDAANKIDVLEAQLRAQAAALQDEIARNAARPSEAQLHARIREVIAHNQRLTQLIRQPSSAVSHRAVSPTLPPGVSSSPPRDSSLEMAHSHWNEHVQSIQRNSPSQVAAHYSSALPPTPVHYQATVPTPMELLYPPAQPIREPASNARDHPNVPQRSMRPVPREEVVTVSRQEMRRESVRKWADENIDEALLKPAATNSFYNKQRRPSAVEDPDVYIRTVSSIRVPSPDSDSMRAVESMRRRSPPKSPQSALSPVVQVNRRASLAAEAAAPPANRTLSRSRSAGEIRLVSQNGSFLPPSPTGQTRTTDASGRPLIPRRASVSRSPESHNGGESPTNVSRTSSLRAPPTSQSAGGHAQYSGESPTNAPPRPHSMRNPALPPSPSFARDLPAAPTAPVSATSDLSGGVRAAPIRQESAPAFSVPREDRSGGPPTPNQQFSSHDYASVMATHENDQLPQEVVVEFEDAAAPQGDGGDMPAPRSVNTTLLPPHESFVATTDAVIVEDTVAESMVAEQASVVSEPTPPPSHTDRAAEEPVRRQTSQQARQQPEVVNAPIAFEAARSRFLNSEPLIPQRHLSASRIEHQHADPRFEVVSTTNAPIIVEDAQFGSPASLETVGDTPAENLDAPAEVQFYYSSPASVDPTAPHQDEAHATPLRESRVSSILLPTPRGVRTDIAESPRQTAVSAPFTAGETEPADIFVNLGVKPIVYDAVGVGAERLGTINHLFNSAVSVGSGRTALAFFSGATDPSLPATMISWKKFGKAARQFARTLCATESLSMGSRVAIVGDNCAEWAVSFYGTVLAGCIAVSIHSQLAPHDIAQQVNQVEADIVVVDSPRTLKRVLLSRGQMPSVRKVVVCHGLIPPRVKEAHEAFVFSFEEFLASVSGVADSDTILAERESGITPECCAVIAFTSGTTQQPKPVMFSHDNVLFAAWAFANGVGISQLAEADGNVRLVSHMSLGDISYVVQDIILPVVSLSKLRVNVVTYFSKSSEDTVSLMQHARPTIAMASPSHWKAIIAKAEFNGVDDALTASFLGLAESKVLLWGGSAWNHGSCLSFCRRKGLHITECYTLAEASGIACTSTPDLRAFASCGAPLLGTEIRINPVEDRDAEGLGEMHFRGRNVAIGYFKCPSLTHDNFDSNGFVASGDVGHVDVEAGGLVFFHARTTDLVCNVHGEYVNLSAVEESVRLNCPALSSVIACGANRPKNICLVSVKTVVDPETGRYTDTLAADTIALNPSIHTAAEARVDPAVTHAIGKAISTFNKSPSCVEPHWKVSRFGFLQSEPTYESDELTVNGKLRRFVINERYAPVIEKLYEMQGSKRSLRSQASQSPSND